MKRILFFTFLFGLLLISSIAVYAGGRSLQVTPDYLIQVWETEDGLPENSATAMTQTPDGYLWFGTFNGLVRFNGIEMKIYDPSNTPIFSSVAIINVHTDKKGRLWVSTDREIALCEEGRWYRIEKEQGWTSNYVKSFSEDAQNQIVLLAHDGHVFQVQGKRVRELEVPTALDRKTAFCLFDSSQTLWLGSNGYLARKTPQGWIPVSYRPQCEHGVAVASRSGGFWILEQKVLKKIVNGRVTEQRTQATALSPWSLFEDHRGNVWICTYNQGVVRTTPEGQETHYSAGKGLTYNAGRFAFEDREKVLWIGTSGGGLHCFKPKRCQSYTFPDNQLGRSIKSILESSPGEYLAATYGSGLARLEAGRLTASGFPMELASSMYRESWFPHAFIGSIGKDGQGRLWIGGTEDLNIWDGRKKIHRVGLLDNKEVFFIFRDHKGQMWVGTNQGLFLNPDDTNYQFFGAEQGLTSKNLRCMAEDVTGGRLWVGSMDQGLFCLENGRFRRYSTMDGLLSNHIHALHLDAEGKLWAGTNDGGLALFRNNKFYCLSEKDRLPTRNINAIQEDSDGIFWLGSNRGIIRVPRQNVEAVLDGRTDDLNRQLLDYHDGMLSMEISGGYQPNSLKDSRGRLWFCTMKGLVMIDPQNFSLNEIPPEIHLEAVLYYARHNKKNHDQAAIGTDTESVQHLEPPFSPSLELPAGSRRVEFHYAGLSSIAPEKVRYQVMLEGHDSSWIEVQDRRVAYYHNLPPGEYRFRVRGANNDGVWGKEEIGQSFTIMPFYWQTNWFQVLLILGISGSIAWIVIGIFRYRLRRREELLRQKEILDQERFRSAALTQFASDIILLLDQEKRVEYESLSAGRILGYPEGFLLSKDLCEWIEFFHPEDSTRVIQLLEEVIADKSRVRNISFRFRHSQGSWVDFEASVNNLLDNPAVKGILVTARDVSERILAEKTQAQLETQLRQSQKMEALGTLAGGIAHDFNNILGAIVGFTWLAHKSTQSLPHVTEYLDHISKASERAKNLIKQILAFSRKGKSERNLIELNSIVKECLILLRYALPATIEIRSQVSADSLVVSANSTQMHQVIMNLCTNAAHAIGDKSGILTVELSAVEYGGENQARCPDLRPGSYVQLMVKDTGHGMTEEIKKRIFDPFFTTKAPGKGTGLGLAVVHGIVKDHQGGIEVLSQPEMGTTFYVYFPLHPGSMADTSEKNVEIPRGNQEHILVVDDEEELCRSTQIVLEQFDYRSSVFSDPGKALHCFRKNPQIFDLVLTDLSMPVMSGLELATEIHKINPQIPILLVSGYLESISDEMIVKAGIRETLIKPVNPSELGIVLHRLLQNPAQTP